MFLLIILFGLAAFGLVFALYMQADLPVASHAKLNQPVVTVRKAPVPQPDSASAPAPAASADTATTGPVSTTSDPPSAESGARND